MPDFLDSLPEDVPFDMGTIGEAVDEIVEMNLPQLSLLNHATFNVSVVHELDGYYDELITEPQLAVERPANHLYTLMTSGFFHRIRVNATEEGQRYNIRFVECTMLYQGQLS